MSNAAKICISTPEYPPRVGGVGVAAQRLAHNLVAAGYCVHVVTPCDTPGAAGTLQRTEENGVVVHRLFQEFRTSEAAFAYRQLVRQIDDEINFDLFHGFFLSALHPCIVAVQNGRPRPVIASIRGSDALVLLDNPYYRRPILTSLKRTTWVTSVNQLYLERVAQEVDIADRSSVIRNGVQPPPADVPTWQLNETNRGVVGTVGEFRAIKDIPLLIRAYGRVQPEVRRRLVLAGYFSDAQEETWSHILSEELGIAEQVEITGRFPHSEVYRHLRALHIYVQSSAYEGLPNALLEAASLGIPLVSTAVGGMKEVLVDGESALLAPHGDPAALGTAIERILCQPDLAQKLSQGARRLAAQLSFEHERDQWLALYDRLLAMNVSALTHA